jgi:hypothetical protein
MWGLDKSADMKKLNAVTTIFDSCGAYDFKNGGDAIAKGSKFDAWPDALTFLEWYGIPHMSGFGIVVIDEENQGLYQTMTGDPTYSESCFESAYKVAASAAVAGASLLFTLY